MRNTERPVLSSTWAFLGFVVVFIVYGSLFPFDFRSPPESINNLVSRTALFENKADALDNFLLFIPLGFSLRICFRRTRDYLTASFLAVLLLGLGLQLIQLYLPTRTASLADVIWNGIGLAVGLLAGGAARKLLAKQQASWANASPFALLLVLLWFFYETFPFLPTLDYGLLREHVKTAIIAPPFDTMRFVQHLLAAILCGIALQRVRLFGHSGLITTLVGIAAVLLEILVAYGQLRRETLLGMTVGLAGGYLLARNSDKMAMIALATVAVSAYLITLLTPYRGQIADAGFTLTPFSSFMWHNVTRELPPLAFEALAIGSLLWAGLSGPGIFRSRPALWIGTVCLAIALLEVVRVRLIGFHGDTTPLLVAALLGTFAATYRDRQGMTIDRHPASPVTSPHRRERPPLPAGPTHLIALVLLAAAIYVVVRLPGIPYNIRELLPHGIGGILAALGLSAAVYLAANSPLLLLTEKTRLRLVLFPLLLPLQGAIIWMLLRIGVPMESIHDIVGAPTLGWPWEWEIFFRFLALHQALAMQLVGAVLIAAALCRPAHLVGLIYWAVIAMLFAWPLHLVVVDWAATDNLTELMRDGGSLRASSLLAAGILLACLGGTALSAAIAIPTCRRRLLVAALLSAPLAASCLIAGLEPVLVKYNQAFSAAQFLLSPDREHYLPQSTLLMRYILVHALVTAAIAIIQLRAWRTITSKRQ
ncbi:MAG: VanZ family protein [Rhodocyclaceae bacterium]